MIIHHYHGRELKFELHNNTEFAQREFGWILQETFDMPTYEGVDFKGRTVLDCGAYVGETAILFSILGAKDVLAFEPSSAAIRIKDNAVLNGITNITSYRAAIGERNEKITVRDGDDTIGATKLKDMIGQEGREISVFTLNFLVKFLDQDDRAILKMDIEGDEYGALQKATPDTLRRFEAMFIECNDWYEGDDRRQLLMARLKNLGFECQDRLTLPRTHIVFAKRID